MSLVNLLGNLLTPNYDSLYIVHSPILDEAINDHQAKIDGMVGSLVMTEDKKVRVQVQDAALNEALTIASINKTTGGQEQTRHPRNRKTRTSEHTLDTDEVRRFTVGKVEYRLFFSCPVIERFEKNIPQTHVLEEKPSDTWGGYFNPDNRAGISIPWYSYLFFTLISLLLGALSLLPVGIISMFHKRSSTPEQQVWILLWMIFGVVIGTLAGWWAAVLDFRSRSEKGWAGPVKFWGKMLFPIVFGAPGVGGFVMVGQMLQEYGNCVILF
jgi:hypothetical protein